MQVSIFLHFTKVVASRTFAQIIEAIRGGVYKEQVAEIRRAVAVGNKKQADSLKKQLPAFTASGCFKGGRTLDCLESYVPVIVLDFDKIDPALIPVLRRAACGCAHTLACFLSPGGNGLKTLVPVSSGREHHDTAFAQTARYYEELFALALDPAYTALEREPPVCADRSGKDITRLCFLSWDPEAYYNPDAQPFEPLILENGIVLDTRPAKLEALPDLAPESAAPTGDRFDHCVEMTNRIQTYAPGNRNNYLYLLASHCNRAGIPEADAGAQCLDRFDLDRDEMIQTIRSAYKHHSHEFNTQSAGSELPAETRLNTALLATPLIPDTIFADLPPLLREGCAVFDDPRERDVFLTSALAILSGCLPGLKGLYDQRRQYPNLFAFIIAPAASGKSVLSFAKMLGDALHQSLLDENEIARHQYRADLADYKIAVANHKHGNDYPEEPDKPPFKVLFIPANASSAMVIKHLRDTGGAGIMCETEADTLGAVLKQDWGGYSDLLRKAFHFEKISYSRKGNAEFYEIAEPRLSVAISGTPNQVLRLIPGVEDGLFSRFLFYAFAVPSHWRDVSPGARRIDRTAYFADLSNRVLNMTQFYQSFPTEFDLTPQQWQRLNALCSERLEAAGALFGDDTGSTVKRLGAILFRIAMILTACRCFDAAEASGVLLCDDLDFEAACLLTETYLEHALFLYEWLPQEVAAFQHKLSPKKQAFLERLPETFETREAVEIGEVVGLAIATVKRFLKTLVSVGQLSQCGHGKYQK